MEVDDNPTRKVLPGPNDPCRRCQHPLSMHIGDHPGDVTSCQVELTLTAVPSLDFGSKCPCTFFVFQPPGEPESEPAEPELLDGPALYAEALGYVRLARAASSPHMERDALEKARTYFEGASAFVLGRLAVENGIGDLEERRWLAALADQELPDSMPETVARKVSEGTLP